MLLSPRDVDEGGFIVMTPLGLRVVCTAQDWGRIIEEKHSPMRGQQGEVVEALAHPDEIRRSQSDPAVVLFYRRSGRRWVSAVVSSSQPAFRLLTAYPTDQIKKGELRWRK
jgi:hypothetical protein